MGGQDALGMGDASRRRGFARRRRRGVRRRAEGRADQGDDDRAAGLAGEQLPRAARGGARVRDGRERQGRGRGPAAEFGVTRARLGLQSMGKKLEKVVAVPFTAQDLLPAAAQLQNTDIDCILVLTAKSTAFSFLEAMQSLGMHQRLIGSAGNVDEELAKAYPTLMEGAM